MKLRSLVLLFAGVALLAQSPITFRYFYDDLGQLAKVVDSTGIAIDYIYDPVGNILEIKRSSVVPGALTIFSATPQTAPTGGMITIQGQGFSTTPSQNTVTIGGLAATVVSATATSLVVTVPTAGVTGPISVMVGTLTATSDFNETIVPIPAITSIGVKSALAGTTIATFTVVGTNLNGSTFSVSPQTLPAKVNISAVVIATNGTSATMTLAIDANARGRFTLIAANNTGSSDPIARLGFLLNPAGFNTLTVPGSDPNADPDNDTLTNAQEIALGTDPLYGDTDGDSWPDGLEVLLGSNPLDAKSVPNPNVSGLVLSPIISMLNNANPSGTITGSKQYVSGLTFSMLNNLDPSTGITGSKRYVSGLVFSMLNNVNPSTGITGSKQYVASLAFSLLNMANPSSGATGTKQYVSGLIFSILNSAQPATLSQKFVNSLVFSISNTAAASQSGLFTSLLNNGTVAARTARPWLFLNGTLGLLDSDGDGIPDEDEIRIGTNPYDADTDHDGYPDGLEIALGSDPLDPNSIPNINPPGFVISPDISIQNYTLRARTTSPVRSAELRRK